MLKIKKIIRIYALTLICLVPLNLVAMQAIKKVNDSLYIAQIPKRDGFFLVIEKVTENNIEEWREYARSQDIKRISSDIMLQYGINLQEGSGHFKSALDTDVYRDHDFWIAYATQLNPLQGQTIQKKHANILMFVTVISKPRAIISSHLGIAASLNNATSKNPAKGISMHLHAFAARVMRLRNPALQFMVNAPAASMEAIMYKNLPRNKLFIGTIEMQKVVEAADKLTYKEFLVQNADQIKKLQDKHLERIPMRLKKINNELTYELEELKENETPESVYAEFEKKYQAAPFYLDRQKGQFVLDSQSLAEELKKIEHVSFIQLKNPIPFVSYPKMPDFDDKNNTRSTEIYMRLFQENPPILSVDGERGRKIIDTFSIYNPKDRTIPILTVDETNRNDYEWMFMPTWLPAGYTHYVVVDINALVDSDY